MSDKPELRWVDPNDLRSNSWNPNSMTAFMYAKALESIQTHGFVNPVIARRVNGHLEIVDGEHRWRVAIDLGLPQIPVFDLGEVSDTEAKKLTILLNELRGQALPEQMGDLLKDLMSETSVEDLLRELPYTEEMFRGFTDLGPLPDLAPTRPADEMGLGSAPEPERRWVERLYRLPLAAAMVLDQALAQAKDGDEIEDWQALERVAADFLAS